MLMRLSQAQPQPTAVLINKFDAGGFQRAANSQVVGGRHCCVTLGKLSTPDGTQAHGRLPRKFLCGSIAADPLYQHLLLTAEKKFWRCVESGEPPRLFGVEPPRPRIAAVRIVDMSASNSWAEFAGVFRRTRQAFLEHEKSKAELKGLMPEDAKEAVGHGVRAKRSKSGAVSFDLLEGEGSHAAVQ